MHNNNIISTQAVAFDSLIQFAKEVNPSRGCVIGIGNDVRIWSLLAECCGCTITFLESAPEWSSHAENEIDKLCEFKLIKNAPKVAKFDLGILNSSFLQMLFCQKLEGQIDIRFGKVAEADVVAKYNKLFSASSFGYYLECLKGEALYRFLRNGEFDWVYIDGPWGGYKTSAIKHENLTTDYCENPNSGRFEVICAAALALRDQQSASNKRMFIDDSQRTLEAFALKYLMEESILEVSSESKYGRGFVNCLIMS